LWTVQNDTEVAKHVLKYHFLTVENKNDLYECWIFCKILDALSDIYKLKFKEGSRSDGVATFQTSDGLLKITYQKRYETEWMYKDKWLEDKPDIAIEYKNGNSIIIDAKNSDYVKAGPYYCREQMDSYMNSANARYGILVFSLANTGLWKEITRYDKLKIVWTHLTPSNSTSIEDAASSANLRKIIDLIQTFNSDS
jgi:hypothetical protein